MPTEREKRLASDYREMLKIQDQPYLSWIATKGDLPYAEEYLMTIRIRTYVFNMKDKVCTVGVMRACTVKMTLWPSYPITPPDIRMLNIPPVFHPDWYSKGVYCSPVQWHAEDSLKDYVKTMIATLRYDPDLIETASPANYKALDWYLKHRDDPSLFPSDTTELTENSGEIRDTENAAFAEIVDQWTTG